MSTYLDLKLKMKGQPVDQAPYVLNLCTTPARELAEKFNFEWNAIDANEEYRYWTVLTMDEILEIQNIYQAKIDDMQRVIVKYSAEVSKYSEMLPKATTPDMFEHINQLVQDANEMVEWAKEEKEMAEYRLYDFRHIASLLEDNKNFEIVYYIG